MPETKDLHPPLPYARGLVEPCELWAAAAVGPRAQSHGFELAAEVKTFDCLAC